MSLGAIILAKKRIITGFNPDNFVAFGIKLFVKQIPFANWSLQYVSPWFRKD